MNDALPEPEAPSSRLELRRASTDRPVIVVVPERRLLAIQGAGHPRAADFRLATTVLRTVDGILRLRSRHDHFADSPKSALEVVWLTEPGWATADIVDAFTKGAPRRWRQMIELPPAATDAAAAEAIDEARRQGGREVPLVRLIHFIEGRSAQVLQVGGPSGEARTVSQLYRFVAESGSRPRGDLHQIVLANPDVVPPERARSIFRLPV